jgi:outer membrane receptor protein involved in Fe transport
MRHIPEFNWAAGVHYGTIKSYTVFDGAIGYNFNPTYGVLLNVNNLNNDVHNEIIGGPELGRHVTLKLTARF